MNGLNTVADEVVECPLCMEPLEVDDLNFYPCTCGYQICRFCWHRIRTDENELCPACRKEYPENPADFTPLTQEEMIAFKSQKRQRDQQRKQKITENRKHLANVRVVQKNLVFVVGLPPRLADADVLKKHEYFGKYGKIHKVVINPSTTYAGVQGPSASAYVTYVHNNDALRAIQSVNNIMIDGRLIKTSLGTTKYCSHFMKNQLCPKGDCMYLHELGDPEASFTKEEMHQGKHQEYEKRLHDALIATFGTSSVGGIGIGTTTAGCATALGPTGGSGGSSTNSVHNNTKNSENTKPSNSNGSTVSSAATSSSTVSPQSAGAISFVTAAIAVTVQPKEAWPSLSVSPVNNKEEETSAKNRREKAKNERSRNEKNTKTRSHKNNNNKNQGFSNSNSNNSFQKEHHHSSGLDHPITTLVTNMAASEPASMKIRSGKIKEKHQQQEERLASTRNSKSNTNREQQPHQQQKNASVVSADDEVEQIESTEQSSSSCSRHDIHIITSISDDTTGSDKNPSVKEEFRSMSSNSNVSTTSRCSFAGSNSNGRTSTVSESNSGKSSPSNIPELSLREATTQVKDIKSDERKTSISPNNYCDLQTLKADSLNSVVGSIVVNSSCATECETTDNLELLQACNETAELPPLLNCRDNSPNIDGAAALSNLHILDDNKSFFSSTSAASYKQSVLLQNKIEADIHHNNMTSVITPHLPDLLNGIDGYQNNANDFLNIDNSFHGGGDLKQLSQAAMIQQQQQLLHQTLHPAEQIMGNALFGTNMSKFFDFHKNQQQQLHQYLVNGYTSSNNDHLRMASMLGNNCIHSQLQDQPKGLLSTQQQLQKQISMGKYDTTSNIPQTVSTDLDLINNINNQQLPQQPTAQHQPQHNRVPTHFMQNLSVDDDLGFDPFIETQKALAELMEHEIVQQKETNSLSGNETSPATKTPQHHQQQQIDPNHPQRLLENVHRARMPPPGFTHMNAFGVGMPRVQSTSKILPFVNPTGSGTTSGQPSHQQQQLTNTWNPHAGAFSHQQQQHPLSDMQFHQINQSGNGNHTKGYGTNDWTAMDPAILSFRQFSSFPQHPHIPNMQQQDVFAQHLTQQNNIHGFGSQSQQHSSANVPNALQTQAQVNANVQGMLEYLKTRQFV